MAKIKDSNPNTSSGRYERVLMTNKLKTARFGNIPSGYSRKKG